MSRGQSGFSLIELMVVVVIIGTLASIALPNYVSMQRKAREGAVKQATHTVHTVVEDYAVTHDGFRPANAAAIDPGMFPQGVYPANPFTNVPITIGPTGTYSQGNVGYTLDGTTNVYRIEGYGHDSQSGPGQDGVVIVLTNG